MDSDTGGAKVLLKESVGQLLLIAKASPDMLALLVDCEINPKAEKCMITRDTFTLLLRKIIDPARLNLTVIEALAKTAGEGKPLKGRKVAEGQLPVDGKDGAVDILIRPARPSAAAADTRYVRELQKAAPGMIVARILPPGLGTEGVDLFGGAVKAKPGKAAAISCDGSLSVKQAYAERAPQLVTAVAQGFLAEDRGRLRIQPALEIKADVDLTSGSIDTLAAVRVTGDLAKGQRIQALGEIELKGRTHGGSLKSLQGSVRVGGLVLGAPGMAVSAARSFSAGMLQNLTAEAGEDIIVAKDARDSRLTCEGALIMPQGHLFGGRVLSLTGVEALIIGSASGSPTVIEGRNRAQIEALIAQLDLRLAEVQKISDATAKMVGPFAAGGEKLPGLDAGPCRKINEMLLKLLEARVEKENLEHRRARLQQASQMFYVSYGQKLHKGTAIKVGEDVYTVESDLSGPAAVEYNGETRKFRIGSYRPLGEKKAKAKI